MSICICSCTQVIKQWIIIIIMSRRCNRDSACMQHHACKRVVSCSKHHACTLYCSELNIGACLGGLLNSVGAVCVQILSSMLIGMYRPSRNKGVETYFNCEVHVGVMVVDSQVELPTQSRAVQRICGAASDATGMSCSITVSVHLKKLGSPHWTTQFYA